MAQFKQYKLGFDRMFHVADVTDDAAKVQMAVFDAQQAAIKPGLRQKISPQLRMRSIRIAGMKRDIARDARLVWLTSKHRS
jgi:hypothetical protein